MGGAVKGAVDVAKKVVGTLVDPFIPDAPNPPKVPKAAPASTDPSVQDARRNERQRGRLGRASTLLTGALGVSAPAPVQKKKLLGG